MGADLLGKVPESMYKSDDHFGRAFRLLVKTLHELNLTQRPFL